MEPAQVLAVEVETVGEYGKEEFYARMGKDGRITIPKLTLELLEELIGDNPKDLVGRILEVTLAPLESAAP